MIERLEAALSGRYRIERELGAGGMATVYLAEDVRHHRNVALKVLKPELAAVVGAERFLAEIETTANLQHPHILPLFDSGEADGFLFYVMPYVEGESLRERLDRERQLPVDEAVELIAKVADALQYAHEQGVVHRDVKPANILLARDQPLVADFGIALAVSEAGSGRITETGLSLGTPHYMSPEQASGERTVDRRSDVYALGCVLYELLTGQPPYGGPTAQAVLAGILTADPTPPTEKRKSVPVHVEHVVLKSLEKIPADRFGSVEGFRRALADPGFRRTGEDGRPVGRAGGGPGRKAGAGIAALAIVALGAGVALGMVLDPAEAPPPVFRAVVGFPEEEAVMEVPFGSSLALSPDGSTLVYAGPSAAGAWRLWVRRADALRATPVPGSDHAFDPIVSPDGDEVAFLQDDDLRIVRLRTGSARSVADSVLGVLDWTAEGLLYYSHIADRDVRRVPAGGGPSERVPGLRVGDESTAVDRPWTRGDVLPGGKAAVWTYSPTGNLTETQIVGVDLETGDTTYIAAGRSPRYLTSGYLVWVSPEGVALGAPFETADLARTASPRPIADGIRLQRSGGGMHASFSDRGDLVYLTAASSSGLDLVWVDRTGETTTVDPDWKVSPTGGGAWDGLAISPDGIRVVSSDGSATGAQIWIKNLESGTPPSRLTFEGTFNTRPRWSPDGRSVTYVSNAGGSEFPSELWIRAADGSGSARPLVTGDREIEQGFISPDGEWVVYRMGGTTTGRDIYALRLGEDSVGRPLVSTNRDERAPDLSPDGRWLAYTSNETGQDEIFIRPFPDVSSGKWQVSAGGGMSPLWSRSGEELFYVDARGWIVAAYLDFGDLSIMVRSREPLFGLTHQIVQTNHTVFDVAPGDDRLLMLSMGEEGDRSVVWVRNWLEGWRPDREEGRR